MQRLSQITGHLVSTSFDVSARELKQYTSILVSQTGRVATITLHRPKALNALNDQLMSEVSDALARFQAAGNVGCIILTGSGTRAFAAGADIKEMKDKNYYEMSTFDKIKPWEAVADCTIPIIAAVNGFALGGGCEVAMMCDIMLASTKAKFGQPEIKIGTIPGAGGTQRLIRAIGKSKAMEMCLTGRMMGAVEAKERGLVASVHAPADLLAAAEKLALEIATLSLPLVKLTKEAVNASQEATLTTGMRIERRLFHSTFGLQDRKEGMSAFAEKRKPQWTHQ
jgi:enoyl-CoA hydratase/carnithine racemase